MPDTRPSPWANTAQRQYTTIRERSMALCATLSDADATLQSMEDASPAKWHLAHTSWFFETFILAAHLPDYAPFDPQYVYLFNSYYDAVGARHPRPQRGLLSRPSLEDIRRYRTHVDAAMGGLMEAGNAPWDLVQLGLHHEQQHQELLLTDLLHAFAQNPIDPCFRPPEPLAVTPAPAASGWTDHPGGLVGIGADPASDSFAFDCETPKHQVHLAPFRLKNRAVTNAEWSAFMADGGYDRPDWWLSDGWAHCQSAGWDAPLYWREDDAQWTVMTLRGRQPIDPDAPVTHISFYEADAFASWAGHRLPREEEWEAVAATASLGGNDASTNRFRPAPQTGHSDSLTGLFGDVWEWTGSAFRPYPGFKIAPGAVGEYNGKFMSGQMVLRGGSCATPHGHSRATYRNFFHPEKRWQFSGLRLASDA